MPADETIVSFENPPVTEVVMGVQFQPLTRLLAVHTGRFWERLAKEYPKCTENPPIIPQIEDFARPGGVKPAELSFVTVPPVARVFYEHVTAQWIIQLQRDRFLHNWRRTEKYPKYPRYPAVKNEFIARWRTFKQFVDEYELGMLNITQLEITYLNQIGSDGAKDMADIGDVFPDFRWGSQERELQRPETCAVDCSFKSSDERSRLRVSIKPALSDKAERMILFELTVRGSTEANKIEEWFDCGRNWIVTAFADLTSNEWHAKWGRTR